MKAEDYHIVYIALLLIGNTVFSNNNIEILLSYENINLLDYIYKYILDEDIPQYIQSMVIWYLHNLFEYESNTQFMIVNSLYILKIGKINSLFSKYNKQQNIL